MRWIVGIDEVGRGALAGPVVVAAAAMPRGFVLRDRASRALGKLKDSKKLTARRREAWFAIFAAHPSVAFSLARAQPRSIDKLNISRAANLAAARALRALLAGRPIARAAIYLDGGLFLGNGGRGGKKGKRMRRGGAYAARTLVRGDERVNAVKAASIVAKVRRDALMRRLGEKYPAYGFGVHKGYGTAAHRAAIRKHGPSPIHRLTFIEKSSSIRG